MTTFRQIEANRRNARKSTGPVTQGKECSRCNAVRHGLMAETVSGALEDAEDYQAFEAAIVADYDAQSVQHRVPNPVLDAFNNLPGVALGPEPIKILCYHTELDD
jgi:hypothetical protein